MGDDTWESFEEERAAQHEPARFPAAAVATVAGVILLHLAIVLWMAAGLPPGRFGLIDGAGLKRGAVLLEPWRLFSSLFVHADVRHALANGISMLVFAVPLLSWVGRLRTAAVYLATGVGGGVVAVLLSGYGPTIIGSSGAVSGLFGAWVVLALDEARRADLPGRARLRTLGVALLLLPSLIQPTTPGGQPVSVSSHLGGAGTGMLLGALLSRGWLTSLDAVRAWRS